MNKHSKLFGFVGLGLMGSLVAFNAGGDHPSIFVSDGPVPPVGSYGGPDRHMTNWEIERWKRGRARFDIPFTYAEGLGTPEMNADGCRACHMDPVIGGAGALELNVSRFANDNGGAGPFMNLTGGQGLSKLRPPQVAGREEHDDATADVYEQRQTPAIFGAGLIDGITEAEILANEDPTDSDGDGIYGVARMVDTGGAFPEVGRYGWKGQVPFVADFIRDAMGGECGITTPDDGRGFAMVGDTDGVGDPELSPTVFSDVAFFLEHLAPPPRGGSNEPGVLVGEALFDQIGCAKCHIPQLQGFAGPVKLYSNLLLHDVMPDVGDPGGPFRGMEEPGAPAGMFKTPVLWGVSHTAPYMHDGRAEDLDAAIMAHFSEAESVRLAYEALTQGEKDDLILFLEDL